MGRKAASGQLLAIVIKSLFFSRNHFPPMRGQCGQGGNLVPDGFTDTTGHTRPALISCRKVPAEPGRARGRSFKRKRALGERAWNGQTLAASSTGQQLRQGSQLGQKGQGGWACPALPRPTPCGPAASAHPTLLPL